MRSVLIAMQSAGRWSGTRIGHDEGMRCLLAAIRCEKGDLAANLAAQLRILADAAAAECDLAVFPETSLTGSVDPAAHPERLISLDHPAVARSAAAGRVAAVQRKRHLGAGEEAFTLGTESVTCEHAGGTFGIVICAEAGYDGPFDAAASAGAGLILFPAAPGLHGRRTDEASWRRGLAWWEGCALGDARRQARRLGLWIALAGQAGVTADEDFPGLAAMVRPDGSVAARLPDWRPGVLIVDVPTRH